MRNLCNCSAPGYAPDIKYKSPRIRRICKKLCITINVVMWLQIFRTHISFAFCTLCIYLILLLFLKLIDNLCDQLAVHKQTQPKIL